MKERNTRKLVEIKEARTGLVIMLIFHYTLYND